MIALVDYGAGNLQSVANALDHLEADFEIVEDPDGLAGADKIVLPGVGAAGSCMRALQTRALDQALRTEGRPLLGICLGMQVLSEVSAEGGSGVPCLGVLPGQTARFSGAVKLPQIGWNTVSVRQADPLLTGIASQTHFYFLHSYRVHTRGEFVLAESEYGESFPAVVRKDNLWGVQFHPEKSGPAGLRLLQNFVELC